MIRWQVQRLLVGCVAVVVAASASLLLTGGAEGKYQPQCRVENLPPKRLFYNSTTHTDPLGAAISEATSGDTLLVIGACHGNWVIDKSLTIRGHNPRRDSALELFPSLMTLGGDVDGGSVLLVPAYADDVRVSVEDFYIRDWEAVSAYGIRAYAGTITVRNVAVFYQQTSGVANLGDASITINDSVIGVNGSWGSYFPDWVSVEGGGLYNGSSGTMVLHNTTVGTPPWASWGNVTTERGAGIYNAGSLTLNASEVSSNGNGWHVVPPLPILGGGIYNTGSVVLNDSTVTGNVALQGGGIYNLGSVTLNGTSAVTANTPNDIYSP